MATQLMIIFETNNREEFSEFDANFEGWPLFKAQYDRSTDVCSFTNEENLLALSDQCKHNSFCRRSHFSPTTARISLNIKCIVLKCRAHINAKSSRHTNREWTFYRNNIDIYVPLYVYCTRVHICIYLFRKPKNNKTI